MEPRIRQPVVVVLGHVDSGKTSLLDKMRGTAVQAREVGGMTQHIGASFFPTETLMEICGPLLSTLGAGVRIPGVLVIDTPGHEVFTNLRARGGSAADISILVVDVTRGFEVQTYESIGILKVRKVPFVVALNKIDLISGWRKGENQFITSSLKAQQKPVLDELDNRIYEVMGSLSRQGFASEVFYRVEDFTRQIAIVPVSAKTGEGIPELISIVVGLTQQYLQKRLHASSGPARGIVLEIKEEVGLGITANVVVLDGVLRVGESVVLGRRDKAIATKVKAIFMPKPLDEMRDPRDRFTVIEEAVAAAGVKIVTPDLESVLPGSPLVGYGTPAEEEAARREVMSEVQSVFIRTDVSGVVVKADALGSLEALTQMLKRRGVQIRMADIGPVTRRDVVEAKTVEEKDPYLGVIISFGAKTLPDAEQEAVSKSVRIFSDPIVYNLIQAYLDWVSSAKAEAERREFEGLTLPCRFKIIKGFVFRRSGPAIFGVEVHVGRLKQKAEVMNASGEKVGSIRQIQDEGKAIDQATTGMQVAVSMDEPTVGRQVHEDELLFTLPREEDVKLLISKYAQRLGEDELKLLKEIVDTRRKIAALYGF